MRGYFGLWRVHTYVNLVQVFDLAQSLVSPLTKGWEAIIRVQSNKKNHPAVRLMAALRDLDVNVLYASVQVVNDLMNQQATVKMSSLIYTQEQLTTALFVQLAEPPSIWLERT